MLQGLQDIPDMGIHDGQHMGQVQDIHWTHMQAMSGLLRAAACCAALPLEAAPLLSPTTGAKLFNNLLQPA